MSRTGELIAAVLLTLGCQQARCDAPTSLDDLSPVERQQADFYGAIAGPGPGVKVSWVLGGASVELGGDIELTLKVHNAVNPTELLRPILAERPEWKAIFATISDLPSSAPGEFRYRLKPRNMGEFELPVPKYRYYNPRAAEGRRFLVAFAEAPKLSVMPPAPVSIARVRIPLDAPERLFEERTIRTGATAPSSGYWWALLAVGVLGVPASVALWRWRNPDAARLARIRRAKSVRAALDAVRKAERSPEPAERISQAMLRYFTDRWRVPPSARTPREVSAALTADGRSVEMAGEAESLLALCDEARFARSGDKAVSLPDLAVRLIETWEGAKA